MPELLIFVVASAAVGLAMWFLLVGGREVEIVDEDED